MPDASPVPPPLKPTNKVTAGVFAGGLTALVVWGLKQFAHVDMPAEPAIGLSTVLTFVVQYFTRDSE